jgi:isoleucyl-tRNA synthetase
MLPSDWKTVLNIREKVLKTLEEARQNKIIGHSLSAQVTIVCDKSDYILLTRMGSELTDILIVSQIDIVFKEGIEDIEITVSDCGADSSLLKCPRCWHYTHSGLHNFDGLCDRCCDVLIMDHPEHPSIEHILKRRKENDER